jgi:fatty acid desaturase
MGFLSLRRRVTRRVLLVTIGALPLFVLSSGQYQRGHADVWTLLLFLPFFLYFPLARFSSRVLRKTNGVLDERQRLLLARAYAVAYKVAFVAIFITLLSYMFSDPSGPVFELVLLWSFYLIWLLPTCVIAWLEPDPPAEEVSHASNASTRPTQRHLA